MNPLIVSTCVITVGVTELGSSLHQVKGKETLTWAPTFKPLIGAFVMGVLLLGVDEVAPEITGKLCALIIVGVLLVRGKPVFDFLSTL